MATNQRASIYGPDYVIDGHEVSSHGSEELEPFKRGDAYCRYCRQPMRTLKETLLKDVGFDPAYHLVTHRVLICDLCGWWQLREIEDDYDTYETDDWYVERVGFADSVAEHFDIGNIETPVDILRRYLARRF